jgi:hypothetical protein
LEPIKFTSTAFNASQKTNIGPGDIPFLCGFKPGGGPQTPRISSDGKFAYLVLELDDL